jgi:hypothetical protein
MYFYQAQCFYIIVKMVIEIRKNIEILFSKII